MYSQRTIALKRYSTLSIVAQLLWCLAATALVVLLQLPIYAAPLMWFGLLAFCLLRHARPTVEIKFDEVGAWYAQGEQCRYAQLVYRNRYWLVIKLCDPLEPSRGKRFMQRLLAGHALIFHDQFLKSDYRYTRSRLSVAKFMNEPAPKNEF